MDTQTQKAVVMEHEMVVNDILLKERKELTTLTSGDGIEKSVLVHTRTIGDRVYEVRKVMQEGVTLETTVNTSLTNDEAMQFETDWNQMWQPTITDAQVNNNVLENANDDQQDQDQDQQQ